MNFLVDVIIVGDSTSGHGILDKLATGKPNLKIAFVSQTFKSSTTHDYVRVKYFKDEAMHIGYRQRLYYCYLKNGDIICGTHLVIASGVSYEPFTINGEEISGVYNTVDDLPNTTKDQSALVVYNRESDIKFAIDVAKNYKQVYICTKEVDLKKSISAANAKKLAKVENLTVLPNTSISKITSDRKEMQKVVFDNYSEINCSAIYVKTASSPAINFVPRKVIPREDGYLSVKDNCESELAPKCFAAGNCLKKYTKAMEQKLIESIIKDF